MRTAKKNSGFIPVHHPAPDPKPEGDAMAFAKAGFEVFKEDTDIRTDEEIRETDAEIKILAELEEVERKEAANTNKARSDGFKSKYKNLARIQQAKDLGVKLGGGGNRTYVPSPPVVAPTHGIKTLDEIERVLWQPKSHYGDFNLIAAVGFIELLEHRTRRNYKKLVREMFPKVSQRLAVQKTLEYCRRAATQTHSTIDPGLGAIFTIMEMQGFLFDPEPGAVVSTIMARPSVTLIDTTSLNEVYFVRVVGQNQSGAGTSFNMATGEEISFHGSFVQENATIPHRGGPTLMPVAMGVHKAAVICSFSNKLLTVDPAIMPLVQELMRRDTNKFLDKWFLDPAKAPVAGVSPGSPWNGAPNQASSGNDLTSILTDLRFLFDTISAYDPVRDPVIIMNPKRLSGLAMLTNANGDKVYPNLMNSMSLEGFRVIQSTSCADDQVFALDCADIVFGIPTAPEFTVTQDATLVFADDDGVTPTMVETGGVTLDGSLKVSDAVGTLPPAVVGSLFQQASSALRMVLRLMWNSRSAYEHGSVGYLTAVNW